MQPPPIRYSLARFYLQKIMYGICALPWKLCGTHFPMGNQRIPLIRPPADFMAHLKKTYADFRQCYDGDVYDTRGTFKYCDSFGSFSHYVFAIISFFNCRNVYEIGTYFGCMTMMMVKYFHQRGGDFSIETIDIRPRFHLKYFQEETAKIFEMHKSKVLFHVGNSKHHVLQKHFDLVILDGSHFPADVWQDFWQVKERTQYILFDDLHMYENYERVYKKIIAQEDVEEIFLAYTNDCGGGDPHCIALVKMHH